MQITEQDVKDWILCQHLTIRNISKCEYSAITLTSNGHNISDIGLTVNIYDGSNHIQGAGIQDALDKLQSAQTSRLATIERQLAILQAEKEQLEAVELSKEISDKMKGVAA